MVCRNFARQSEHIEPMQGYYSWINISVKKTKESYVLFIFFIYLANLLFLQILILQIFLM